MNGSPFWGTGDAESVCSAPFGVAEIGGCHRLCRLFVRYYRNWENGHIYCPRLLWLSNQNPQDQVRFPMRLSHYLSVLCNLTDLGVGFMMFEMVPWVLCTLIGVVQGAVWVDRSADEKILALSPLYGPGTLHFLHSFHLFLVRSGIITKGTVFH